jgi:hypothetical protein
MENELGTAAKPKEKDKGCDNLDEIERNTSEGI